MSEYKPIQQAALGLSETMPSASAHDRSSE